MGPWIQVRYMYIYKEENKKKQPMSQCYIESLCHCIFRGSFLRAELSFLGFFKQKKQATGLHSEKNLAIQ